MYGTLNYIFISFTILLNTAKDIIEQKVNLEISDLSNYSIYVKRGQPYT